MGLADPPAGVSPAGPLATLRLLHPFPSVLNALLVLALALLAGGAEAAVPAVVLAAAMLCLQFSIGAANDYFDAGFDARTKPAKPIPAGHVRRVTAARLATLLGIAALALAITLGPLVMLLAAGMLAAGQAYNVLLKRGPWAWLAYSAAFPLLPLYAWYGAAAELPPRWELLLPMAALAGPALQLANGVVDLERDRAAGLATLAGRLGQRHSILLAGLILAAIHVLAWLSLAGPGAGLVTAGLPAVGLLGGSAVLAALGLVLLAADPVDWRERGWQAQTLSIALLAGGWLLGVLRL